MRDQVNEERRQARIQPLVLEIVSHVRHRWSGGAELDDSEAVERSLSHTRGSARPWLNHRHTIAPRPQSPGEFVRAPSAAATHGREGVGGDQDVHQLWAGAWAR